MNVMRVLGVPRQRADAPLDEVRAKRLENARKTRNWTEIPQTSLVPRGRHYLVHAETDELFTLRGGEVFEPGKASIGYIGDGWEMHYFVDQAGEVVFLERQPGLWSDIVARQARRR